MIRTSFQAKGVTFNKPNSSNTKVHWCILSKGYMSVSASKYFNHFPHAAEGILPCWSWFRKANATSNCGLVIMDGLELVENSWQKQLVDVMKCRVEYRNETYTGKHLTNLPGGNSSIQFVQNVLLQKPGYSTMRYLAEEEDAHALRRLFVDDIAIYNVKDYTDYYYLCVNKSKKLLQIGLLQREGRRVITNLHEIREALRVALPYAEIHTSTLDYPLIRDQALWFATKNIIIGAHGAGLTNALFITKGTIVLQIWPDNWFWQSLDSLIEQSAGIALDWYPRGKHPVVTFETAKRTGAQNFGRESNITPPVEEVVDRILMALGAKMPNQTNIDSIRDALW